MSRHDRSRRDWGSVRRGTVSAVAAGLCLIGLGKSGFGQPGYPAGAGGREDYGHLRTLQAPPTRPAAAPRPPTDPAPISLTAASPPPAQAPRADGAPAGVPARRPDPVPETSGPPGTMSAAAGAPPGVLPISLETVFRLAEQQNKQIALARARVEDALTQQCLADQAWLPEIDVGTAYYRHEGGIQDFRGPLIHSSTGAAMAGLGVSGRYDVRQALLRCVDAERQVWQQRGEFSKVNTETLLEAATAYIDLLAARTGQALLDERRNDLNATLERTRRLVKTEPGVQVDLARIEGLINGREFARVRVRQQVGSASAKLAYLLGVDPALRVEPVEARLGPIELVDVGPTPEALVNQVLQNGPGVRELAGLIRTIEHGLCQADQPYTKYLPTFEVRLIEGGFGAGPGANLTWDNRFDVLADARWNLTEAWTARERKRLAESKLSQATIAYQDLREKLTAGVYDAREVILAGREQIRLSQAQIDSLKRALDLTSRRLESNVQGTSSNDLVIAIQGLGDAQLNYLTALREYDKAQLRLLLILGATGCGPIPAPPGPVVPDGSEPAPPPEPVSVAPPLADVQPVAASDRASAPRTGEGSLPVLVSPPR